MIGLFFIGMGATLIGALIAWWVINNFVIKDEEKRQIQLRQGHTDRGPWITDL